MIALAPQKAIAILPALAQSMTLRPYQARVKEEVYRTNDSLIDRILVVAPTGAGKTIIFCSLIADAVAKGQRVLIVVHRDVLIKQTHEKLRRFGIDCGFIKAGWAENRDALVQIASIQTLPRRHWWKEFKADIVILDEAHVTAWAAVVERMMDCIYPNSTYLGFTATPWRLSKKEGMGDRFNALVAAPMPHQLMDSGYLVKPSYYALPQADLKGVRTLAGDFAESDLSVACDRPELIKRAVDEWFRLAEGRQTLAFTVSISHSLHLCEAFQAAGISAAHVDGTTPIPVRNRIYEMLAAGEILVVTSCAALQEGFDVPSVSAVLLCRPTKSKALYFQQIGRGLRISPETGKTDCIVLDQAGNVRQFGFVEDLKQVSLEEGRDVSGVAPTKVCPKDEHDHLGHEGCGAILSTFEMRCRHCGYQFPVKEKLTPIQALERLLSNEDKERFNVYRALAKEAYERQISPGYAARKFKDQFGHWAPDDWGLGAVFGDSPTTDSIRAYLRFVQGVAQRKDKDVGWVNLWMRREFGKGWQQAIATVGGEA
ncbi:DEAD/DEAH box helicase [Trichocoleus desertorum AS-A10]|uniref:DEAD/DEAH box helicase n=1 Tax=Trichocoleus desertorum TaxID=1481672 RepID=UPI00329948CC